MAGHTEVTLEVAMAWVFARDPAFLSHVEKGPYQPVEEAFANFDAIRDTRFSPACSFWSEAWRLLRDAISSNGIVLRGVEFTPGQKQIHLGVGLERFAFPPPKPIPPELIPHLHLEENPDGAELHYLGGRERGSAWWRHVQLDNGAVFEAFPTVPLQNKRPKKSRKPFNKNLASYKKIKAAIEGIWPDGKILVNDGVRDKAIIDWLADRKLEVSRRTLSRFFESHESGEN